MKMGESRSNRRIEGEVVIRSVDLPRTLSITACTVILIPLIFASLVSYSRKETVTGWIVPDRGMIRIVAREGGVIDTISVAEGDEVKRGQAIASLTLTARAKTAEDIAAATERNLNAELVAHDAVTSLGLQQNDAKRTGIEQQRLALLSELDELEQAQTRIRAQLGVATRNLERLNGLAERGFVSKQRIDEVEVSVLGYQREAASSRASIQARKAQLVSLETEAQTLIKERAAIGARGAAERAQLEQRRLTSLSQNQYVVTAPIAGRITALPLQRGQVAGPASAVAILTPGQSKLCAELYVKSKAIGFIRPGQRVKLMYDAYPYEKFGVNEAIVREVSDAVLATNEVGVPGLEGTEPVFRVRAELPAEFITAYGRRYPLRPGSSLKADIIIERRSLLEWILEPLYRASERA